MTGVHRPDRLSQQTKRSVCRVCGQEIVERVNRPAQLAEKRWLVCGPCALKAWQNRLYRSLH